MQIVSDGDNLHEMSNPVGKSKKNIINLLSVEFAQRVIKVKGILVSRSLLWPAN